MNLPEDKKGEEHLIEAPEEKEVTDFLRSQNRQYKL
jgi:hypothetical protein